MPEQFIIGPPHRVGFVGDEFPVFVEGDGALGLKLNGWPVKFRQHRPRQPVHRHGEMMDAPEINIGRHGARLQRRQKMFGQGFDELAMADAIQHLVLDGRLPAHLGVAVLGGDNLRHHVLPRPRGHRRIAMLQIDLRDLQVHGGLVGGLVLDVKQAHGVGLVAGAERSLFAGAGIFAIEDAGALEQDEPMFHVLGLSGSES